MMPKIGKFPPFCKRFFRQARKLVGSCHFEHFWRVVLAIGALTGRRSINRMKDLFGARRTRQAIANFLKYAAWDAPEVLRLQAQDVLQLLGCRAGDTVYLLLDDTQKRKRGKKMAALSKIFLHAEKVYATGHTLVACALVFRGVVIPFRISLWASEKACQQSRTQADPQERLTFRKITQLGADAIAAAPLPEGVKGIVLFDSYYLCPAVTDACGEQGFRYVGAVKKNRNFFPDGRDQDKRRMGKYGKNVLHRDGRTQQVDHKPHRLAERVGRLSKAGRVKLVFSRRPGETSWIALATNETRWSAKRVLGHYLKRWGVEVFFKMSKQYLGLGDYQLLRYRGIERYLCLVLIAYLLLTHQAVESVDAQALDDKKIELRLASIPQLQEDLRRKLWDDLIDQLAKGKRHKATAKKIKDRIMF